MTAPGVETDHAAAVVERGAVGGALLVAVAGGLPALLTGAVGVQLREDLGFGVAALGTAVAVYSGAGALGAGILGGVADRIGWRRALRLASLLIAISLLGTALVAHSWIVLAGFLVLGGLGHATGLPGGNLAIATAARPDQRAMLLGLRQAGVPAAGLLAGLSVPLLATTVGWRWAFAAGLVIPLVVLVLVAGGRSRERTALPVRPSTPRGWARFGFHRPQRAFAVFLGAPFIGAGLVNTTTTFVVSSLVESGFSAGIAGLCFTLGNLIGMVTRAVAGIVVSRQSGEGFVPLAALLTTGSAGFVLLAVGGTIPSLIGLVLVFAGATGWPGLSHFIAVTHNPANVGAASGLMMTGAFLGGTLAPLGFGIVAQQASFGTGWTACAVLSAVAGALVLTSRRLYRRAAVSHGAIDIHRIVPPRPRPQATTMSSDETPLLSSLWPFSGGRAPQGGSWPEDMRDRIVEHVRTEHGAMLEYERLAEQTEAEDIAYLMQIILDDERRHHRLFRELRNSLEAAIELRNTGSTVPVVGTTPVPRGVLDATRRLLAIEREDKEELQTLRKAMKPVEESTLWALLVDIMLHDTEKHIAILEQILTIAEERVDD